MPDVAKNMREYRRRLKQGAVVVPVVVDAQIADYLVWRKRVPETFDRRQLGVAIEKEMFELSCQERRCNWIEG